MSEAASEASAPGDAAKGKSALSTIVLLAGVAVVVGTLMAIYGALGIGIGLTAFGSLFLLYWAGLLHQSWSEFLPSLVGGWLGIALAWLLTASPQIWGTPAAVAGFVVLGVILYFYLRGEGRAIVNNASMLFLILATIPELQVRGNALIMAASLTIGAIYIGAISLIARRVRIWRARRTA